MTAPLISVSINTYNHEPYIEKAIVSVLEQNFPTAETEVLVVDDGSTDNTPAIIRKFAPRVRYLRKENGGQITAYNAALPELQGQIVAFIDGDDWWARDKLSAVAEAFATDLGLAAVGHGYYEVDDSDPKEVVVPTKACRISLSSADAAGFADAAATFFGTSRLSARRRVLEQIGPLPNEGVFFDMLVFALSVALGGAFLLEAPLCYYRHHVGNLYNPVAFDAATHRRRMAALSFRLKYVPQRLLEFGVPQGILDALLEVNRTAYDRLRLQSGDDWSRWDVFRTELRRFRANYKRPSIGYRLFECAVGACALVLPPAKFYRMLNWYERNDIKRFRAIFGKAEPKVSPDFCRRTAIVAHSDGKPGATAPPS
jgi:glycosyltransferase involved in cell wall biosynthesis